jgi:hypothetical protein
LRVLIPESWFHWRNAFTHWLFGIKTEEEKNLLYAMMKAMPKNYLKWAMLQCLNWKNTEEPKNTIRIHGTNDHVLYYRKDKIDFTVENAGHFMVYANAEEVNEALAKILI